MNNDNMEIERKYLVETCPFSLHDYPSHEIEQGYLNTEPVVRIRRYDDSYVLTYKSKGSWSGRSIIFHSQKKPMNICVQK